MSRELRPHQARIIERLRESLSTGHRRPMLQAPTGFGKTVVAGAIVKGALAKGKRVLFVVPAISLIDQTVRSFWAEGIQDIGVIQAAHPMTRADAPVQVASIQSLQRRAVPPVDIVVIDEAHRWFEMLPAPKWSRGGSSSAISGTTPAAGVTPRAGAPISFGRSSASGRTRTTAPRPSRRRPPPSTGSSPARSRG